MPTKPPLKDRLAFALDLPKDIVLDLPRLTVLGDLQIRIENHRGLVEFESTRAVFSMVKGKVVIEGEELTIGTISAEEIIITGQLKQITFVY